MNKQTKHRILSQIRDRMAQRGVTYRDLAKEVGSTSSHISNFLNGKSNIGYLLFLDIISYLEINIRTKE